MLGGIQGATLPSVTTTIDASWQYATVSLSGNDKDENLGGPYTGCTSSGLNGQNLIAKISLTGGWFVDWMEITWLDGTRKAWGLQPSNAFQNLTLATFNGEVWKT